MTAVARIIRSRVMIRTPSRNAWRAVSTCSAGLASKAGLIATRAATTTVIAACTTTVVAAPTAPTSAAASAGPTITATLRLVASIALALSSSSGPAISAIALKKLPVLNGRVTLYRTATAGTVQSGACPTSATIASSPTTLNSWSITISTLRWRAVSIHAPSTGPLRAPGSSAAAAVTPASA